MPRHLAWLALAWGALVIYGSLTPFEYRPRSWSEAAEILQIIADNPPIIGSRADWLTNVLILVPIGFAGLGALLLDRDSLAKRIGAILLVFSGGLVLTLVVEGAQLWFRDRYPAKADVIAQTLGNFAGMGAWVLVGQPLAHWSRRHLHGPPASRLFWLLAVYAGGLAIYSLLPLDLTMRPGELWDKWQEGRIAVVPFAGWEWNVAGVYAAVRDAALYIPIGILMVQWFGGRSLHASRLLACWLWGVAFVAAIEVAQLFVASRYSDVTDLILGSVGAGLGVALTKFWQPATEPAAKVRRPWLPALCLIVYALLLAAVYLEPFELTADRAEAMQRLTAMVRVPLEALRHGEPLGMISNVLRKLALFGILGWLAGETLRAADARPRPSRLAIVGIFAGALVSAGIEIAQAWFPPHVPDLTDVFWGGLGGAIGALLRPFVSPSELQQRGKGID